MKAYTAHIDRGMWMRQARCSSAIVPAMHYFRNMRGVFCAARSANGNVNYPEEHQALIPPPGDRDTVKSWMDAESQNDKLGPVPDERRVYCNRTMDLSKIEAVGFDMDYTLAQYKPETFEHLAYTQTVSKLTEHFGYPQELKSLSFDWQYMMRGLTIDKVRGNVLKVDRHKYVKIAFHGFQKMTKGEKQAMYAQGTERHSFDTDDFTTIDTLFSLAEAYLFMQIVELKDTGNSTILRSKAYKEIYSEIRGAVDLCHRDGSLKKAVAANPAKYIHQDKHLKPLLDMYRRAGRKVFLATNSLWDYTNVVMNFVVDGRVGSDRSTEWLKYFDTVMTGCCKPGFFTERNLLFAVSEQDSRLSNTDGGAPILPIDQADLPATMPTASADMTPGHKVFQGGSVGDLHRMLGIKDASTVLYVGDHIYGDILKSKKSMGWRTMLIVPELAMELRHAVRCRIAQRELHLLRVLRDSHDEIIQRVQWDMHTSGSMECSEDEASSGVGAAAALEARIAESERIAERHKEELQKHHQSFHPVWGQMLKAGYQNSMYASLLERFACLYTSHVSNMILYSPYMKFRGRLDVMAHEQFGSEADVDDTRWLDTASTDREVLSGVRSQDE